MTEHTPDILRQTTVMLDRYGWRREPWLDVPGLCMTAAVKVATTDVLGHYSPREVGAAWDVLVEVIGRETLEPYLRHGNVRRSWSHASDRYLALIRWNDDPDRTAAEVADAVADAVASVGDG